MMPKLLSLAVACMAIASGPSGCVEKEKAMNRIILNYPIFDGENVIENASLVLENGAVASIGEAEGVDSDCFIMPGLIDAHTHILTEAQIDTMLANGVTATCDVAASPSLVEASRLFKIVSSAGMTIGTLNGKSYVKKAKTNGASYIKVLLMDPNVMPHGVLKDICLTAHESGLKVAVHAVSVKAVRLAVSCGADILIHVPMKEAFPEELAEEIAEKGIAVIPTLVMMETFAYSGKNGYKPEHFSNAKNAVRLLNSHGVRILAGTDANIGSYAPAVEYGSSMHREMQFLSECGLTPVEVLASATGNVSKTFGIDGQGTIAEGKKAVVMLVEGRPDKNISDTGKIKQIWIDGQPILK